MITITKARKLLPPGDIVYTTKGSRVIPCTVITITEDSVFTDQDELFFDEHGIIWWLTEYAAKEHLHERT